MSSLLFFFPRWQCGVDISKNFPNYWFHTKSCYYFDNAMIKLCTFMIRTHTYLSFRVWNSKEPEIRPRPSLQRLLLMLLLQWRVGLEKFRIRNDKYPLFLPGFIYLFPTAALSALHRTLDGNIKVYEI